ncbi:putative uncharacterized protein [Bacteroides sp. CAG:462]|nr:putative uncharacterized protein [Bacteroides sp. CAG:462]
MDNEQLMMEVQSGKKTMLDYVLAQEDLKDRFLSSMHDEGIEEPTEADAMRWLDRYEEMLYEDKAES